MKTNLFRKSFDSSFHFAHQNNYSQSLHMTEYYNKYIKYKNKYLSLKEQIGSAEALSTNPIFNLLVNPFGKKRKYLFIFISNTYSGINELPGVKIDRQKILKSFKIENDYDKVFSESLRNIRIEVDFNIIFINNCNKSQTIDHLESIRNKYDIESIVLCLSGHGSNASGLIDFHSNIFEPINLSEIIQAINNPTLLNITAFLDMCRSGSGDNNDPFNARRLVESINGKRVAVMTAGARTFKVGGGESGGKLINSLCNVIDNNKLTMYDCLKSMGRMLIFIIEVSKKKIEQHINLEIWIETIKNRKELIKLSVINLEEIVPYYNKICKELPSLYFNSMTRLVIEKYKLSNKFQNLFRILCKKYNEDAMLSRMVDKTVQTAFK